MPLALRPLESSNSMVSRCNSQALRPADALAVSAGGDANTAPESGVSSARLAGFAAPGSGVTSLAGFAGALRPQPPGGRTPMPAARRYSAAVSRRTPVAFWIFRSDHPSRPNAITCCFFSSFKTLLTLTEGSRPHVKINVLNAWLSLAGFEVTLYGRFWVTPEDQFPLSGFEIAISHPFTYHL